LPAFYSGSKTLTQKPHTHVFPSHMVVIVYLISNGDSFDDSDVNLKVYVSSLIPIYVPPKAPQGAQSVAPVVPSTFGTARIHGPVQQTACTPGKPFQVLLLQGTPTLSLPWNL
jgi:hypothetical protein